MQIKQTNSSSKSKRNAENAIASAARALSANAKLQVFFDANNQNATLSGNVLRLKTAEENAEFWRIRGEADSAALMIKHHNRAIHAKERPVEQKSAIIFDALERARVEALGSARMQGVNRNIEQKNEQRFLENGYQRISERADPPLADLLALKLHHRITGGKPPEFMLGIVQLWDPFIELTVGNLMQKLADNINNQQQFADITRSLIKKLQAPGIPDGNTEDGGDDNTESQDNSADSSEEDAAMEEILASIMNAGDADTGEAEPRASRPRQLSTSGDDGYEESSDAPDYPHNHTPAESYREELFYKVYTREFDEIVKAEELCSIDELHKLRTQLDQKLEEVRNVVSRLAAKLQRSLMARQNRSWSFDEEDGLIDSARLSRVITNPDLRSYYKVEKESDFKDTIVTLLLDNSGSMRGRPITVAALTADILARTLERCDVKVEILGFTTREWKGGKSRFKWLQQGAVANPGRLNDLRHIIYKAADQPWRLSRRNLGLMLKDGILKENIDGEAIDWAFNRLKKRREDRKIMIVVSDGAPVDDSTLSANTGNYLDLHLRQVITDIESDKSIELFAIGIGHDVTRYYSKAVTISDAQQLGGVMVEKLTDMFGVR